MVHPAPTLTLSGVINVAASRHFGGDPDPQIHALANPDPDSDPDLAIFVIDLQDVNKNNFFFPAYFFLKVHLHNFYKIKSQKKESPNSRNQGFSYYIFLLYNRRIQIQEAQKQTDPADPDPQHWFKSSVTTSPSLSFMVSDVQASGSVPAKPNQSAGKQPGQAEAGGQLDGIKVPTPWASGKREAVQKKE